MKKAVRVLLIIIGILLLLVGGFAVFIALRGIPEEAPENLSLKVEPTPQRLETGRQLSAMLCNDCHYNTATQKLTGRKMDEVKQFGEVYSKNITAHPENGIGKWTDGQLVYLLRTGITPKGKFLPVMAKLHRMSDEDIQSIIVFLRSDHNWVKPDATKVPESKYSFFTKFLTNIKAIRPMPYTGQPIAQPDTTDKIKWGEYVALYRVECYTCHSADFASDDFIDPENSKGFFGGGNKFSMPDGIEVVSRNLTMDEETGIGKWTEDDFVKAVKTGILPNGQPAVRSPMKPYPFLSDSEVRAIFAYLKTLPKISNKVERNL